LPYCFDESAFPDACTVAAAFALLLPDAVHELELSYVHFAPLFVLLAGFMPGVVADAFAPALAFVLLDAPTFAFVLPDTPTLALDDVELEVEVEAVADVVAQIAAPLLYAWTSGPFSPFGHTTLCGWLLPGPLIVAPACTPFDAATCAAVSPLPYCFDESALPEACTVAAAFALLLPDAVHELELSYVHFAPLFVLSAGFTPAVADAFAPALADADCPWPESARAVAVNAAAATAHALAAARRA
jgi:hypothetical protein